MVLYLKIRDFNRWHCACGIGTEAKCYRHTIFIAMTGPVPKCGSVGVCMKSLHKLPDMTWGSASFGYGVPEDAKGALIAYFRACFPKGDVVDRGNGL